MVTLGMVLGAAGALIGFLALMVVSILAFLVRDIWNRTRSNENHISEHATKLAAAEVKTKGDDERTAALHADFKSMNEKLEKAVEWLAEINATLRRPQAKRR